MAQEALTFSSVNQVPRAPEPVLLVRHAQMGHAVVAAGFAATLPIFAAPLLVFQIVVPRHNVVNMR